MTVAVMGSFFVQLVLANSLATRGSEIKELEEKRSALMHEMSILNEQAAELSSVARISREAKEKIGLDYNSSQFEYLQESSLAFSE